MFRRTAFLLFLAAACHRDPPPSPDASASAPAPSLAPAPSSAPVPPPTPPALRNVIAISIDSLRADMPWAGYPREIAPRLTALQKESITYRRAYATSSFTSKSLAGFLTGRYPSELSRTGYFFTHYLAPAQFICTSLGVPCVAGHAHAYFGAKQSGFEAGFADWQLVKGIAFDYQTDPYVTSDKLTPLAIEILGNAAKNGQFFAWFHYMDPHDKYQSHVESPHWGKGARDLYDEEVFYTDLWIGKLLDWIDAQPWAKNTVIVVTADHGEMFGEHGMTRHAHEVWEELIHVPLFFHVPGATPRVIDEPRSHVDLAATFAELLGKKWPGTSLVKEVEGGRAEARDVVADLPEDEFNERRRALIHGQTKIIAFGRDARFSVFDLATDPGEKKDLVRDKDSAELVSEMKARYLEASKRIQDVAPTGGIPKH